MVIRIPQQVRVTAMWNPVAAHCCFDENACVSMKRVAAERMLSQVALGVGIPTAAVAGLSCILLLRSSRKPMRVAVVAGRNQRTATWIRAWMLGQTHRGLRNEVVPHAAHQARVCASRRNWIVNLWRRFESIRYRREWNHVADAQRSIIQRQAETWFNFLDAEIV